MNDLLRLFFAIEVPKEIRSEITRFGATLDRSWKPSRSAQLHITLAFMAEVSSEDLASVIEAGEEAAAKVPVFNVAISETAVFPENGDARVLYAQVDGGQQLPGLATSLRQKLAGLTDNKKIKPHLTLARACGDRTARRVLRKFKGSWPVADFVLYKSILSQDGAVHETLQRFKLTGSAD